MLSIKEKIKLKAKESGFDFCGMTPAETLMPEGERYLQRIQNEAYANLPYLKRDPEKRLNPKLVFPEVKTAIALLMNYYTEDLLPVDDNFIISRYAYGKDYHEILKTRMKIITDFLTDECKNSSIKSFVDTGPVMEKAIAARCGLGWQGKNTLIINARRGSFFFIGIIMTDLELEPDTPSSDQCGNCTSCIDACPTGALSPYQLNPSICLSNLSIENQPPEDSFYENFNNLIYGCDICQNACPYNRFALPTDDELFQPDQRLKSMNKEKWLNLTREDFNDIFKNSPVKRKGYDRFIDTVRKVSAHSPQL